MYQVIVGNIGTVYCGPVLVEALNDFNAYVAASKDKYGRAAGESVDLFFDEELMTEHVGSNDCD